DGDAEDLIALTGGPDGPISLALHADHAAVAAARCDRLASLFSDRLYVELQRHGIDKERRAESGLIDLAYAKGLPLVATNEPYFAANDDYEAHDALLCIAGGKLIAETDREQLTPDHRFKTRAEMAVLFADIPEALASTVEIAERCSFRPKTRKPILPRFPVGAGRGSGAGSLVAYSLTITDLDPIRFGLLFERFLNPERVSMPDFDIDFCQDRRGEVIDYVQQRYGRDQVAQIITFGTLQA